MKMPSTGPQLEIAVHSFQSAQAAVVGGADRMELCTALQTGGLTPDLGFLDQIMEYSPIPVHVLIRPRLGNFIYDQGEFTTIMRSIEVCRRYGVAGIVVGLMDEKHQIERSQLNELISGSGSLDLTFHRAIDVCSDVFAALDILMDTPFRRVLTSGQASTAFEGMSLLKKMVEYTKSANLSIMPGAGINTNNILQVLTYTGCTEVHASAKGELPIPYADTIGITTIYGEKVTSKWESDPLEIKSLKDKMKSL